MAKQKKDGKVVNYRLSIVDDQTHKQLWILRFSRTSLLVSVISVSVILFAFFFTFWAFTPMRTFIPGYPDAHTKRAAIQNAIKIDSLELLIARWELYSENLRRVVNGEDALDLDSLISSGSSGIRTENAEDVARTDSVLREKVKEEEQFGISRNNMRNLHIEGMHFFVPLKGVITQGYDRAVHPYIDIAAPANSVVMAVLDGTVIYADRSDESGYTVQVQHQNDIVSIYKHNLKLLKRTGDKVTAGTPIAIVGDTGTLSFGDHLHFELWYKGEAVDPSKYINF